MKKNSATLLVSLLGLALAASVTLAPGCRRNATPAGELKKKPGAKVAKVVFVGAKEACDCTKRKVSITWDVLTEALTKHPKIKVTRIQRDVHRSQVKTLRAKRRYITLPALYFLGPEGKVVGMLEGEVGRSKIDEMLK